MHRTLSVFSSIPTEHRHRRFKLDLAHSFRGGRRCKHYLSKGGLLHVLHMHALDLGLLLTEGGDVKDVRKRKRCLRG